MMISILMSIVASPITCLVLIVVIVAKLRKFQGKLSQQTYHMQRQLFISLTLQVLFFGVYYKKWTNGNVLKENLHFAPFSPDVSIRLHLMKKPPI